MGWFYNKDMAAGVLLASYLDCRCRLQHSRVLCSRLAPCGKARTCMYAPRAGLARQGTAGRGIPSNRPATGKALLVMEAAPEGQ